MVITFYTGRKEVSVAKIFHFKTARKEKVILLKIWFPTRNKDACYK